MSTISLSNAHIEAKIALLGAELMSLNKHRQPSVLKNNDTTYWNRIAPNLFPIVGRLKDDTYKLGADQYTMNQHGFARNCLFSIVEKHSDYLVLSLTADKMTKAFYPFEFEFRVLFQLVETEIRIEYLISNTGLDTLPFSVGGHPGFQLTAPITEYYLEFKAPFVADRYLLCGAYYSGEREKMEINRTIPLHYYLFAQDALVFIHPPFQTVTLKHNTLGKIVTVSSNQWDAIGFWTKADAPFLCIEPWWGWADELSATGNLFEKAGIHVLAPGKSERFSFQIEL